MGKYDMSPESIQKFHDERAERVSKIFPPIFSMDDAKYWANEHLGLTDDEKGILAQWIWDHNPKIGSHFLDHPLRETNLHSIIFKKRHADMDNLSEKTKTLISHNIHCNATLLVEDLFEKGLLEIDNISNFDPDPEHEIYEWWFVSDFLYKKLLLKGEFVINSKYGYLWGRAATGQAIFLDGVMQEIGKEINL